MERSYCQPTAVQKNVRERNATYSYFVCLVKYQFLQCISLSKILFLVILELFYFQVIHLIPCAQHQTASVFLQIVIYNTIVFSAGQKVFIAKFNSGITASVLHHLKHPDSCLTINKGLLRSPSHFAHKIVAIGSTY